MLPSFNRLGEALRVCRETGASLNKWHNSFYSMYGCEVSLSLLGTTEENISLLGEAMAAMATYLRDLSGRYPNLKIVVHDKYVQAVSHLSMIWLSSSLTEAMAVS